ncbi:helix-turn-helix transcriptional regulator [Planctomycetota bacterium]
MLYNSLFEGEVIKVELHPYHLFYNQRAWYVLGCSNLHNSVRTFKLNRIRELKVSEEYFANGEDFDIYEHLGRAWSIIPEGKIYNIELKFLPKVANNVSEVCWHSTQKVYHNRDGSVIMEFRVDGLTKIMWWVLGYGDKVQVLKPKMLREKVLKIAQRMIALNQDIS